MTKRLEFVVVFEVPDGTIADKLGEDIEDMMNTLYPDIYMDVIWQQGVPT